MKLVFLCITAALLSSCSIIKKTDTSIFFDEELKVLKLGDTDVSEMDLTLTLQKNKKSVTGFSGCNSYFGSYFMDGNNITFSKIQGTKKYCESDKNNNEKLFLKFLKAVTNYNVSDKNTIVFLNKTKEMITISKSN